MSTSLEIVVICSECGEELDSEVTMEGWKSTIRVEVKPCACQQIEDDEDEQDDEQYPSWFRQCSPELAYAAAEILKEENQ